MCFKNGLVSRGIIVCEFLLDESQMVVMNLSRES